MAKKSRKSKSKGPTSFIIDVLFKDEVTPNKRDDEKAAGDDEPAVLKKKVKGWRVAESLMRLLDQVNQMAPDRKKASDGTIGDPNHQKRNSDHNPWVIDGTTGVVTARDVTHDPAGGCDAQAIADAIVKAQDPRVKYIIWNRRICSSVKSPWKWRSYSGANPHTKHIHISVLPDKVKYDDRSDWRLTEAEVAKVKHEFEVDKVSDMKLAWGKKVTGAFKERVVTLAAKLAVDPNHLMAAMAFETARTFKPDIQNPASKATGLIQFMPKTARSLGTSIEALAGMSAVQQLDFVEAYFLPHAGKLKDLDDIYMAILWPAAVGRPASFVLFAQPTKAYRLNKGLDANDDGAVTKAEAANRVQQHLVEGMREELRG